MNISLNEEMTAFFTKRREELKKDKHFKMECMSPKCIYERNKLLHKIAVCDEMILFAEHLLSCAK